MHFAPNNHIFTTFSTTAMSHPTPSYLRHLILLAAFLLCVGSVLSVPSPKDDRYDEKNDKKVLRVKNGQSIQDAIDHAKPYTRIEVEGHHQEQLTITKDGISLVGKGAKLSPPTHYDEQNYCFGLSRDGEGKNTSAGICIHGAKIDLAKTYSDFTGHWKVDRVHQPVKDVSISGFEITSFNGQNIANYGGKNTKVSHNKLTAGGRYGFLTVGSTNTQATNNIVIGSSPATLKPGPIAMCMDDFSRAEFSRNDVSNYYIGLCTETSGGINKGNVVHGCCLGNIIDPGVKDAKSIDNHIFDWNRDCDPSAAAGISLLGAVGAVVQGNRIDGIVTKQAPGGAGLYLGDIFGVVNEGNTIKKNVFGVNDVDIFDDSKGRNEIRGNECDLAARGPVEAPTPTPEFCR